MTDLQTNNGDAVALSWWREPKNLILGGLVGAAVLVLVGYFLVFSGGGSSGEDGLVANTHSPGAAAASPSAKPTTTAKVAVYKADPYGNPFKPLYPPKPAPSASATTPAADGSADGSVDGSSDGSSDVTSDSGSGTGSTGATN